MRIDPREILRFIERNFEAVRQIFQLQKDDSIIRFETLYQICNTNDIELKKFLDYKILKRTGNNDFQLTTYYQYFFEFILREFSLELPAAIEKYRLSITQIYNQLIDEHNNKNLIVTQINNLIQQVKEFTEAIDNNITRLDDDTKDLKANIQKISYVQKVEKATEWIEYFIKPMNNILDNNHPDSITSIIAEVSNYANQQRLFYPDVNLRIQFDKLYAHLEAANKELLTQLSYLVQTLLPLIHRIKTESQILSGFIEFMKNPLKHQPPALFKITDFNIYTRNANLNAKEIFEHLTSPQPVYLDEMHDFVLPWRFEREEYKQLLLKSLPVENFCQWIVATLNKKEEDISWEKFMSISTLLFEEDVLMEVQNGRSNGFNITVENFNLKVPIIKVNYGISSQS